MILPGLDFVPDAQVRYNTNKDTISVFVLVR